jgi:hypothetical protein
MMILRSDQDTLSGFLSRIFDPNCRASLDRRKNKESPVSRSLAAQCLRLAQEWEKPECTLSFGPYGDAHTGLRERNSNFMRNEARKVCQKNMWFAFYSGNISCD